MASKRILYVEDNFQNKRLVRKILASRGYEVLEADDGLTGVEMASRERPDLILMDISLPGIDGVEATRRIKTYAETSGIPIVALTANAMRGDRERFLAAGCDDYLPKPISTVDLLSMVGKFLDVVPGN
ncbi:MAG TPA: response regulator [Aggregatilinea sp.]|jgi:two-component system cell cycle response regulator DivK|uniref:response regulator n=1 Tax=Aggregatilinea sp. TaxID=2806333 RepID=UPI002C9FBE02|nr:response regulator [Aggregatilinea sp.]HML22321.1 response regulator [Aggregatilinea sp.]